MEFGFIFIGKHGGDAENQQIQCAPAALGLSLSLTVTSLRSL